MARHDPSETRRWNRCKPELRRRSWVATFASGPSWSLLTTCPCTGAGENCSGVACQGDGRTVADGRSGQDRRVGRSLSVLVDDVEVVGALLGGQQWMSFLAPLRIDQESRWEVGRVMGGAGGTDSL